MNNKITKLRKKSYKNSLRKQTIISNILHPSYKWNMHLYKSSFGEKNFKNENVLYWFFKLKSLQTKPFLFFCFIRLAELYFWLDISFIIAKYVGLPQSVYRFFLVISNTLIWVCSNFNLSDMEGKLLAPYPITYTVMKIFKIALPCWALFYSHKIYFCTFWPNLDNFFAEGHELWSFCGREVQYFEN